MEKNASKTIQENYEAWKPVPNLKFRPKYLERPEPSATIRKKLSPESDKKVKSI